MDNNFEHKDINNVSNEEFDLFFKAYLSNPEDPQGDEIMKRVVKGAATYFDNLKQEKDSDYEVNQKAYDNFMYILSLCQKLAQEFGGGEVEPVVLVPRERHGSIALSFFAGSVQSPIKYSLMIALLLADVTGFDADVDSRVRFEFQVNNIFKKKK